MTDVEQRRPHSTPERLAYWYFRLNGFLTTENFVVHPDMGNNQRTDADLLGVRFAYRAENLVNPMQDDPKVAACETLVNVVIAEVKTGQCSLNGPWTNPKAGNMRRVMKAIGCVPENMMEAACDALYRCGRWTDANVTVRLIALGEARDPALVIPESQQITWDEVIDFCVQRFQAYARQKSSVGQWTADGRGLQQLSGRQDKRGDIRQAFGLRSRNAGNGCL